MSNYLSIFDIYLFQPTENLRNYDVDLSVFDYS